MSERLAQFEDAVDLRRYLAGQARQAEGIETARRMTARGGVLATERNRQACYLHDYGDGKYCLVQMKHQRPAYDEDKADRDTWNHYDTKTSNNVSRARSTILGLAMANPWDWFVTVTIDKAKFDRTDLDAFHKAYGQFLRDEGKRRVGDKLPYLMVPEKHADGESWHEHGLLRGLPVSELEPFTRENAPRGHIRDKVEAGEAVYRWPRYQERFGFCDFEPIRSKDAVAAYMSKYVTKSLAHDVAAVGAHTYYCSKGLERPYTIAAGEVAEWVPVDGNAYDGEHCTKRWFHGDAGLVEAMTYMRVAGDG